MKNLIKLFVLCSLIAISAFSCKKENIKLPLTSGYIVGYDPCTINSSYYRIGYFIISTDLKDTLLAYNVSGNPNPNGMPALVVFNSNMLYQIPWIYFQNFQSTAYFPDSLRYKYGIKFSYSVAKESEMVNPMCFDDINTSELNNAIQIIIKSATKN